MYLINFAHPITADQQTALQSLCGPIERVISVAAQFDHGRSFAEQARELVDAAGLGADEWQALPMVVCLPTLHVGAAAVLAELHGRCGYFPAVLRLRPVAEGLPLRFEVAEVMNLQAARDAARARRGGAA